MFKRGIPLWYVAVVLIISILFFVWGYSELTRNPIYCFRPCNGCERVCGNASFMNETFHSEWDAYWNPRDGKTPVLINFTNFSGRG